MTFEAPWAFLLILPLAALLMLRRKRRVPAISFPGISTLTPLPKTGRQRLTELVAWLKGLALLLIIAALARPQLVSTETAVISHGVDIVIGLDLSSSMLAVDRKHGARGRSRLEIAKAVTRDFINRRAGDRIGFIAFAARPYPVAPLTLDHEWLDAVLDRLEVGSIEDGTALGDGILAAMNRLRSSPKGSRTVIVMTDGRSNVGETVPQTAAAAAVALGIRIHTIGVGARAPASFPVESPLGGVIWRKVDAKPDEAALNEIASVTGGKFFRADDEATLRSVFLEIDRLEKRPVEEKRSRHIRELFPPLVLTSLLIVLLTRCASSTWLRRLP